MMCVSFRALDATSTGNKMIPRVLRTKSIRVGGKMDSVMLKKSCAKCYKQERMHGEK